MTESQTIFVETPARLHFGVLDLRGQSGRWFGGIGAAAPDPTLVVSATAADTLEAEGDDAERAAAFARLFLDHYNSKRGVRLHVHRALPSHAGLGSGTQLALAVARALAELHDLSVDAPTLARAVGRAPARAACVSSDVAMRGGRAGRPLRHQRDDGGGRVREAATASAA